MIVERCLECPLHSLDQARQESYAGQLLERTLRLDFNAEIMRIGWDEVPAEVVRALGVLRDERREYQVEKQKTDREKWEEEQRLRQRMANRGGM